MRRHGPRCDVPVAASPEGDVLDCEKPAIGKVEWERYAGQRRYVDERTVCSDHAHEATELGFDVEELS